MHCNPDVAACVHGRGQHRMAALPLILLTAGYLLSGCAGLTGPDYKRPQVASKQSWSEQDGPLISAADTIQPDWWRNFGDAYLDQLIKQAIAGNIDIRILAARTGVAGAGIEQARAGLLPTIEAGAGTDTSKLGISRKNLWEKRKKYGLLE